MMWIPKAPGRDQFVWLTIFEFKHRVFIKPMCTVSGFHTFIPGGLRSCLLHFHFKHIEYRNHTGALVVRSVISEAVLRCHHWLFSTVAPNLKAFGHAL